MEFAAPLYFEARGSSQDQQGLATWRRQAYCRIDNFSNGKAPLCHLPIETHEGSISPALAWLHASFSGQGDQGGLLFDST